MHLSIQTSAAWPCELTNACVLSLYCRSFQLHLWAVRLITGCTPSPRRDARACGLVAVCLLGLRRSACGARVQEGFLACFAQVAFLSGVLGGRPAQACSKAKRWQAWQVTGCTGRNLNQHRRVMAGTERQSWGRRDGVCHGGVCLSVVSCRARIGRYDFLSGFMLCELHFTAIPKLFIELCRGGIWTGAGKHSWRGGVEKGRGSALRCAPGVKGGV